MRKIYCIGLVAFAGLLTAAGAVSADEVRLVQLPPGTIVSTPAEPLPPPTPLPPPVVKPMTLAEFAAWFRPAPGTYEVVLIHPGSGCPVCVKFTLPCGCPRVHVHKRSLEFDYGRHDVTIRMALFGKVKVNYD